jgi:ADP-ribose pyrophosphatase YjhB (NUDIX family)
MTPMTPADLLACAQRIQAIAQAGIAYSSNAYDTERYEELRGLSVNLLQQLTDEPFEKIVRVFASETGYQTPKVDIRAVIFNDEKQLLLVKEKLDKGRWTLPGGWADIGYSPFENAEKEAREETGLEVRAFRLLALFDKRRHPHPPQPWYIYKAFIACRIEGGELVQETPETGGAAWFTLEQTKQIALSTDRVTLSQIETLFQFAANPALPALCD